MSLLRKAGREGGEKFVMWQILQRTYDVLPFVNGVPVFDNIREDPRKEELHVSHLRSRKLFVKHQEA